MKRRKHRYIVNFFSMIIIMYLWQLMPTRKIHIKQKLLSVNSVSIIFHAKTFISQKFRWHWRTFNTFTKLKLNQSWLQHRRNQCVMTWKKVDVNLWCIDWYLETKLFVTICPGIFPITLVRMPIFQEWFKRFWRN